MVDFSLVCDDCKIELFVANQNMGARWNNNVNFFSDNIEQFLATHADHKIRFTNEYLIPGDYKVFGVFTRERSKIIKLAENYDSFGGA